MSDPGDLASVRECLHRNKDAILKRFSALGVGVGKSSAGHKYVIVVYLADKQQLPSGEIEVEGVPLAFEVTGKIRPH